MRTVALSLALCVLACGSEQKLTPETKVVLDGLVLDASGAPAANAPVKLERTPAALAGPGLLPCWPGAAYEDFATTTTDAAGKYSFPALGKDALSDAGATRCLRVSHVDGARAARVAFELRAAQTHLPTLSLQQVALQSPSALNYSWNPPAAPLDREYLLVFTSGGWPVWRLDGVNGSASLTPERAEDSGTRAQWLGARASAQDGGTATVAWTEDLTVAAGTRRAGSRGATCETSAGALASPCLLTDGLFRDALAGATVSSVTVHLAQPFLTSRVLLHNVTASAAALKLEASPDGATWSSLADVPLTGLFPYFLDVTVPPTTLSHLRITPQGAGAAATAAAPGLSGLAQVSLF